MRPSQITKTLQNPDLKNETYSLGFRRFTVLPNRVQKMINLYYIINHGLTGSHDYIVNFFSSMTEAEYLEYLKKI
jgi:hypothetical protein